MTSSLNKEEKVEPLSADEKKEIRQKIESFMANNPPPKDDLEDDRSEVCPDINCYCRLEMAFFSAE